MEVKKDGDGMLGYQAFIIKYYPPKQILKLYLLNSHSEMKIKSLMY